MSAPQPLTGDELAAIKAQTGHRAQWGDDAHAETVLRLVAEVERLRGDNEQGRVNLAHYSEIIDAQAGENDALRTSVAGLKASLGFKQGTIDDLAATVERLEAEAT